jgi:uncharacterized protein YxeA
MKKILVIVLSMAVALAVVSCGSTSVKDMDPKAAAKDDAVKEATAKAQKEAAIATCKKDADKAFDACVAKAGKSAKAKKACDTQKTKAYADCDKK